MHHSTAGLWYSGGNGADVSPVPSVKFYCEPKTALKNSLKRKYLGSSVD